MARACNSITETEEEETCRHLGLNGSLPNLFSKLWGSERNCLEEINKQEVGKQTNKQKR